MIIDYNAENIFTKQIDLVDPGNCTLRCTGSNINEYYILIRTYFGRTYVLKYGPLLPDLGTLNDSFELSYKTFDYKESKIQKEIEKLLQDERKEIVDVEELTAEEVLKEFPDIAKNFLEIGVDD